MLGHDEFESVYTRTGSSDNGDEIGQIQITPVDWQYRRKVKTIIEELKRRQIAFMVLNLSINSRTQDRLSSMIS